MYLNVDLSTVCRSCKVEIGVPSDGPACMNENQHVGNFVAIVGDQLGVWRF